MTKSISLKLDQKIFEAVEKWTKESGKSRNRYINDAIDQYNKKQQREALKERLKKEIPLIAKSSLEVLKEFEALTDDYETI